MTLTAPKAVLDMTEGRRAPRNVVVTQSDGNYMNADSLDVDMDKETAVIINGKLYFKDNNIYIYGAEIKKTGKETFESSAVKNHLVRLRKRRKPGVEFSAKDAKVTTEGYFTRSRSFLHKRRSRALFSVRNLARKDKEADRFLTPEFGYSRLRGTKVDNSFSGISLIRETLPFTSMSSKRGLG